MLLRGLTLNPVTCMGRKQSLIPQAAAIVVKDNRFCIVTTGGGQGWVIPKGNLKGSFRQTASAEAWEEAGVRGKVGRRVLAAFKYQKAGKKYRVKVFLLRASQVSSVWPENKTRQRKWLSFKKAMGRLNSVRTRSHDHSYLLAGPVFNELVGEGNESDRMK